jgi:hypothetical protein
MSSYAIEVGSFSTNVQVIDTDKVSDEKRNSDWQIDVQSVMQN